MLRSSSSLARKIIGNYTLQLKSELNLIQLKANELLSNQRSIHNDVKNTSKKDIVANTLQTMKSNNTMNNSNILLAKVSKVHQDIINWSKILDFIKKQPISNPNEMPIGETNTPVSKGLENKTLHELLELCENKEEYIFCSIIKAKITSIAA